MNNEITLYKRKPVNWWSHHIVTPECIYYSVYEYLIISNDGSLWGVGKDSVEIIYV
jgi:hypothetical protein